MSNCNYIRIPVGKDQELVVSKEALRFQPCRHCSIVCEELFLGFTPGCLIRIGGISVRILHGFKTFDPATGEDAYVAIVCHAVSRVKVKKLFVFSGSEQIFNDPSLLQNLTRPPCLNILQR